MGPGGNRVNANVEEVTKSGGTRENSGQGLEGEQCYRSKDCGDNHCQLVDRLFIPELDCKILAMKDAILLSTTLFETVFHYPGHLRLGQSRTKQLIWRPTLDVGRLPSYVGFITKVGQIGHLNIVDVIHLRMECFRIFKTGYMPFLPFARLNKLQTNARELIYVSLRQLKLSLKSITILWSSVDPFSSDQGPKNIIVF